MRYEDDQPPKEGPLSRHRFQLSLFISDVLHATWSEAITVCLMTEPGQRPSLESSEGTGDNDCACVSDSDCACE